MMNDSHKQALKRFIKPYCENKHVIGIILAGSHVHSKPDKNSDLDVYIVLDHATTRERGNVWINGVEIEYFINPVKKVREYFKLETGKKSPATAHMLATGKVLFQRGPQLKTIIQEAKHAIQRKRNKPTKFEKELMKYELDDIAKDLDDARTKKDKFEIEIVKAKLLTAVLEAFCAVKRIRNEKPKRLREYLKKQDKKFATLYEQAITKGKTDKLLTYIINKYKLARPKNWKLKSKVT